MRFPFVESSENRLRIGKIVDRTGDRAIVEYFRSPAEPEPNRLTIAFSSLKQVILPSQTRVYWKEPKGFTWAVGRVLDYQKDDGCYLVRFPNDDSRLIHSDELQVRCNLPIAEPTDHLAFQLNETAFWHSARSEFVKLLAYQHQVSQGLSALLSSSIEIVAHQVSVVRRVLMDSFQRYLLADEVGLGKTIEAGVLIKQFTLDEPDCHNALVIVPEALRVQWQQELTHRFHLGQLIGKSIRVVASHDENEIATRIGDARLIVIDEAHHLCSWAWSSNSQDKKIFEMVADAVRDLSRRVLLLSATPVLHNERSFLAMLHLLDPQVYPLDSLDKFKQRVLLRQEIAERMMDLRDDESNFFLGDTLEVLGTLLADDREFQALREELVKLIAEDVDEKDNRRLQLIRAIRSHVGDMWRLHRRILRSRRNDATSAYLPGRSGAKRITYLCENETGLAESIEAWRLTVSASLFSKSDQEKKAASELAWAIDELAACEPRHVVKWASNRLRVAESLDLGLLPLCEGETDALQQIVRAAKECDHAARLQKLHQLISSGNDQASYVIFASEPETANLICDFLEPKLSKDRVLRHSTNRFEWTQFKSEHRGYVLVCDRTAEEGLNLQKRGANAIHYDLPFSPNRIEQRMGRLDRFGIGTPVQSAVLVCDGSRVQKHWFDLVDGSLGVFHRSMSSLQYVIEDAMQDVLSGFLDLGADAFEEASELLGGDDGIVAKELKRIRAQDAIDSFDTDALTQEFADELENNDRKLEQASAKIFGDWAVRKLQFRSTGEEKRADDVFTYEFTRRVDYGVKRPYGKDTLVPNLEFERLFADSIDKLPLDPPTVFTTVPLTFGRVTSQRRVCRLLRVGDPFVDALERFTRWDDRGVCFAFWRHSPAFQCGDDPAVFFRFDYVISPSIVPLASLCSQNAGASLNAVMRRSRAIMHTRFTTIWLDADLNRVVITDERMKWLKPTFSKQRTAIGEDFNLNCNRWESVAKLYDMSLWRDRCHAARQRSEQFLRTDSGLPKWSEDCVSLATRQAEQIQQQFRSRLAMANGETKSSLEQERRYESQLLDAQTESFRCPELRVDSVGAIFVSNRMPFLERDERHEDDE